MNHIGNETERFVVEEVGSQYMIRDKLIGKHLRYNYRPIYGTPEKPASKWGNYHAALGFCQEMWYRDQKHKRKANTVWVDPTNPKFLAGFKTFEEAQDYASRVQATLDGYVYIVDKDRD